LDRKARFFDKLCGNFFLAGFLLSKLKIIPNKFLNQGINLLALVAYLGGYTTWYLAALFFPSQTRKRGTWYGFAEFKEQFQVTALLGSFATLLCIFNPTLIIPILCIYAVANIFWTFAEYHKYRNPPTYDPLYSTAAQANFMKYVILTTGISLLTAVCATISVIFPIAATATFVFSTLFTTSFSLLALLYMKRNMLDSFEPDSPEKKPLESSYKTIAKKTTSLSRPKPFAEQPLTESGYSHSWSKSPNPTTSSPAVEITNSFV